MKVWFKNPDWQPGNVSCKGANLSRTCTYLQLGIYGTYYTATIAFAQSSDGAWTATIAASGGKASTTCTVQPDPTTAAGAPSLWSSGPTPTCRS